jgi:hypothetical protein
MKEAIFLAGLFFEYDIPREKMFLLKYFRSPLENQFVKYYLCLGEIDNFVDHTGYFCQKKWLKILKKRIDGLLIAHDKYKKEGDLDILYKIENGKFKL